MTNTREITWTGSSGSEITVTITSISKTTKRTANDDWLGKVDMGTGYSVTTKVSVSMDGKIVATGNPSTRVAPNNHGVVAVIGGKVGLKQDQYDAIVAAIDETREAVTTDDMRDVAAKAVRLAEIDGKVEAERNRIESID